MKLMPNSKKQFGKRKQPNLFGPELAFESRTFNQVDCGVLSYLMSAEVNFYFSNGLEQFDRQRDRPSFGLNY
jgi:hypothetical protein